MHSAITAYVILGLAVAGSFARSQQINADARHHLCKYAIASWNERNAIVIELTKHATLPPGVTVGPSTAALEAAIRQGNLRRDGQRIRLLKLQGPRPKC